MVNGCEAVALGRVGTASRHSCLEVGTAPRAVLVRRRANHGRGTIHRALLMRRARRSHAPTLGRPAAAVTYVVTRSRPYPSQVEAMSSHPYLSRHQPPGAATCHLKLVSHFCTFAQAVGRFTLLHLGQHVVLSLPVPAPEPVPERLNQAPDGRDLRPENESPPANHPVSGLPLSLCLCP